MYDFPKVFFHLSLSEFRVKYHLPLSCRYEQYVEDAYVAFLKQKGQAEQVRLDSIMNNDELNEITFSGSLRKVFGGSLSSFLYVVIKFKERRLKKCSFKFLRCLSLYAWSFFAS